jgi:hypothetical protein
LVEIGCELSLSGAFGCDASDAATLVFKLALMKSSKLLYVMGISVGIPVGMFSLFLFQIDKVSLSKMATDKPIVLNKGQDNKSRMFANLKWIDVPDSRDRETLFLMCLVL